MNSKGSINWPYAPSEMNEYTIFAETTSIKASHAIFTSGDLIGAKYDCWGETTTAGERLSPGVPGCTRARKSLSHSCQAMIAADCLAGFQDGSARLAGKVMRAPNIRDQEILWIGRTASPGAYAAGVWELCVACSRVDLRLGRKMRGAGW